MKKLLAILLCVFLLAIPALSMGDETVIEIADLAAFQAFAAAVAGGDTYSGKTVRLMDNITLPSGWTPVGWHGGTGSLANCKIFAGTFDGNGKTVTLPEKTVSGSNDTYIALFARNEGIIENLTVAGGTLVNTNYSEFDCYLAGIAAYNKGTVRNCASSITVNGNSNNNNKYIAGVVAYNDISGIVEDCTFTGGSGDGGMYKAGIVARNYGTVRRCWSNADIQKGYNKGGIVAVNELSGLITECYFVGRNMQGSSNGGIAHMNKGTISYCFTDAALSGQNPSPAALVYENTGTLSNSYSPNDGSPLTRVNSGTVTNCYYDSQAYTGSATQPTGAIGLPTLKMTQTTALDAGNMDALGGAGMWTVKANTMNTGDVTLYYPQLKCFADKGHTFINTKGYTLTFDANGAFGSIPPILARAGADITLPGITAPAGSAFEGWTRSQNGTAEYAQGDSFNASENSKLYAVWTGDFDAQLSIDSAAYDLNPAGANHIAVDTQVALGKGRRELESINYNGAALVKDTDYTYSDGVVAFSPAWLGGLRTGNHSIVFHFSNGAAAAALDVTFTLSVTDTTPDDTVYRVLTFETNGGNSLFPVSVKDGTVLSLENQTPVRGGYTFSGWYADEKLTNKVGTLTMDANKTVYAKWTPADMTIPQTGDGSGAYMGMGLALALCGVALAVFAARKRRG